MSSPGFRRSLASLLTGHVDAPYDPEHREFIERISGASHEHDIGIFAMGPRAFATLRLLLT